MSTLLIRNARLLVTMDAGRREIEDGAVFVRDQVIEAVSGKGFAREKVKEGIDMLLRHGEAMEPKNGIIQLI